MTLSRSGPRDDEVTPCKKCGASMMFLQSINKKTGKRSQMPVNVIPTRPEYRAPNTGEVTYVHGEHQPHWGTCPFASDFRSKR